MNVKQFLCAGMTGALLVAGLTACAPGAPEVDPSDVAYQTAGVTRDTVLFTVDGTEVTADEYLFWLLQSVASAKQSGYLADDDAWEEELNGVPTAEYLKEDARNTSVLYTTVSNHAAAAGLTVTEEEQAEADADDVMDELIDRYGDPPRTVNNLISVALLRADAARNGISQIDQKGANLNFYLDQFDLQRVSALCGLEKYRSRLLFSAGERPYLALRLKKGEDALKFGRKLVEDYAKTAPAQTEG